MKILLLAELESSEARSHAEALGADDYLPAHFHPYEFLDKLTALL